MTAVTELGSVGDGADAVILMLPDSDIVERVLLGRLASEPADRTTGGGLLVNLAPGTTIIDMSSSDPARTRVLAELVAAAGMTLIDAPVSGGVAGARAGTLMIMVGGPSESFERFKPMLVGHRQTGRPRRRRRRGPRGEGAEQPDVRRAPAGVVGGTDRGPPLRP